MNANQREDGGARPCLIIAHGDATYAALVSRSFRRLGWDVYPARSGPEARRLSHLLQPDLLVMASELDQESGWLTCEKVTRDIPHLKVFLVGDTSEERNAEFARFVGAVGFIDSADSVQSLVEEICGRSLPAAG
jgi:CheY-like chemotaxis protein